MSSIGRLSHPEIEYRPAFMGPQVAKPSHITLVDLLEIYSNSIVWKEGLDHSQLLSHFSAEDGSNTQSEPPVRVLFIYDLNFHIASIEDDSFLPEDTTAHWLRQRFGVSPLFLRALTFAPYPMKELKEGNSSFLRRNAQGNPTCLDGVYRLAAGLSATPCHVWYSHSLGEKHSTYMIDQCAQDAKSLILSNARGKHFSALLRPLAIDAFLAEDCLHKWAQAVVAPRKDLIAYEKRSSKSYIPQEMTEAVEKLHFLSQHLHIIREDLMDLDELLRYLLNVHRRYVKLANGTDEALEIDSVHESFEYLMHRGATLRRWVMNYADRAGICINLFFHLANQTDSKTNLEIAQLTSRISVSTQRDSSSMITMAAVTMLFLPGTFVSAVFSMVFFDIQEGVPSLVVSPQWWFFLVITIPLTILVFGAWIVWQRYRNKVEAHKLQVSNLTHLFGEKAIPS